MNGQLLERKTKEKSNCNCQQGLLSWHCLQPIKLTRASFFGDERNITEKGLPFFLLPLGPTQACRRSMRAWRCPAPSCRMVWCWGSWPLKLAQAAEGALAQAAGRCSVGKTAGPLAWPRGRATLLTTLPTAGLRGYRGGVSNRPLIFDDGGGNGRKTFSP